MNGIDPKWVVWLGVLVTVEQAIGQGTVKLTNVVPVDWAPWITAWCNLLAFAGTAIMTALSAFSSKAPGPMLPK